MRRSMLHADPRWRRRGADPQDDRGAVRGHSRRRARADVHARVASQPRLARRRASGFARCPIVDLACWDAAARLADLSIADLLGGRNRPMPATAIIGYPPGTMGPEPRRVPRPRSCMRRAGGDSRRPSGGSAERTAARLRAARAAAPDAWLGMDAAWVYEDVDTAAELHRIDPGRRPRLVRGRLPAGGRRQAAPPSRPHRRAHRDG